MFTGLISCLGQLKFNTCKACWAHHFLLCFIILLNTGFLSGSVLSSSNATVNKRHNTCPHDAYSLAVQQTLMIGSPKFYNVYYQQNKCYEFPELWYSLRNQGKLPHGNTSLVVIWRMNWRKKTETRSERVYLRQRKRKNQRPYDGRELVCYFVPKFVHICHFNSLNNPFCKVAKPPF